MWLKMLYDSWADRVYVSGHRLKKKYRAFKQLLTHDQESHQLIAEIEDIYYHRRKIDLKALEHRYRRLSGHVSQIITCLQQMSPHRYQDLPVYFKKLDTFARFFLPMSAPSTAPPYVLELAEINEAQRTLVGGKALPLARARNELELPVPPGFAITTNAFHAYIEHNGLQPVIDEHLAALELDDPSRVVGASRALTEKIMEGRVPGAVRDAIGRAFAQLEQRWGSPLRAAVRSSAVAEDSEISFAGQYVTVLNVGAEDLVRAYKRVIAGKYSRRALIYRVRCGLSDRETPMAVLVFPLIEALASGVLYTRSLGNPEAETMRLSAVWGLGELLVSGQVSPDVFTIEGHREPRISAIEIGDKKERLVIGADGENLVEPVPEKLAQRPCIDEAAVLELARWGAALERFFNEAQDIEWCIDSGRRLHLLQTRPLRLEEEPARPEPGRSGEPQGEVLLSGGECASRGVGGGRTFVLRRDSELEKVPPGAVLVARYASPHYISVIERLAAVVTDVGSAASHFASVAREFRVPLLVNTGNATRTLESGLEVTVDADRRQVTAGVPEPLPDSGRAAQEPFDDSPYMRKLRYTINFISPLTLTDPQSPHFTPGKCRSLHDIIRFCHEMAVAEMFALGDRKLASRRGAHKLVSAVPLLCYVVDVGGGLNQPPAKGDSVSLEQVRCRPLLALWQGLTHPDIRWSDFSHFDWAEYDRVVMSGGIISADSAQFASYAVISSDYLNLNLKFGYHFVILDTLCGDRLAENHILFRFTGGGASFYHRSLRAEFLRRVLDHLQFRVSATGDLIEANFKGGDKELVAEKLEWLGRLLGATRLMDMYLDDASLVADYVQDFLDGRYDFADRATETE